MTNEKLTYGDLLHYDSQIQNQTASHSICAYHNRTKNQEFYRSYRLRIETAKNELKALDEKFLVRDDKGKYEIIETEGKKMPKLKEGLKAEDYQAEMNLILSREILM